MVAVLDRWFHPKRAEQEQLQNRIKELQELSSIAMEIGNTQIYRSLQAESNELFMKFLTYAFFDGLRFIAPHLLLLAIITSWIKVISLPVNLPLIGTEISVTLAYLILAPTIYFINKKRKNKKLKDQLVVS